MLICGTFRGASERVSFGVRQLAAAFLPASLLAVRRRARNPMREPPRNGSG